MGFFDKLKASIGVGGAKIELHAPAVVTSGSKVPMRIMVRGGKVAQKLDAVEVALRFDKPAKTHDGKDTTETVDVWAEKVGTAGKQALNDGVVHEFSVMAEIPSLPHLYEDPQEHFGYLLQDEEEQHWKADGPLPFADVWTKTIKASASADIPGAINPSSGRDMLVVPEVVFAADGTTPATLVLEPAMSEDALAQRLDSAYHVNVMRNGDSWVVWWSHGTRVGAWAELKAIASVRPEGVVRTHTNASVPRSAVLEKLPSETTDVVAGGMDEAFELARQLAPVASLTVLPRPVGNTVFGLANLHIADSW